MDTTDSNATENPGSSAEDLAGQAAAFQKIWLDTFGKLMQAAISAPPNTVPPEIIRQMRSGIFQGLARTWDEFLRSPQFMDQMKQSIENAVFLRKMTNDFLTRVHHEMQGTAREDIDTVMLAVRHMEQRILDRLEKLEQFGLVSKTP